jgi:hypothetical protein
MLERIYDTVPNIAFHKIVRQYGFWIGKPVFTQKQQDAAFINYIHIAKILN